VRLIAGRESAAAVAQRGKVSFRRCDGPPPVKRHGLHLALELGVPTAASPSATRAAHDRREAPRVDADRTGERGWSSVLLVTARCTCRACQFSAGRTGLHPVIPGLRLHPCRARKPARTVTPGSLLMSLLPDANALSSRHGLVKEADRLLGLSLARDGVELNPNERTGARANLLLGGRWIPGSPLAGGRGGDSGSCDQHVLQHDLGALTSRQRMR